MKKIELVIIALANHRDNDSDGYVVVLRERNGQRRLSVVIGGSEAKSIIRGTEDSDLEIPMAHDALHSILDRCKIELKEVYISQIINEVFHAELHLIEQGMLTVVDCRTSDALALSLRAGCPIFTSQAIMNQAGISWASAKSKELPLQFSNLSAHDLELLLDEALDAEDFERAAFIRDELRKRKE